MVRRSGVVEEGRIGEGLVTRCWPQSVARWLHARKKPGSDQKPALLDSLGSVHGKDIDRRSSDGRSAGQHWADPGEMLLPNVLAGVEESRQQTRIGIEAGDIRPLVEVVIQAGQRQVFSLGQSVVLLGNDVVDLEGQNVERLRKPTVFAGIIGADPNLTFQRFVHCVKRLGKWARPKRSVLWHGPG